MIFHDNFQVVHPKAIHMSPIQTRKRVQQLTSKGDDLEDVPKYNQQPSAPERSDGNLHSNPIKSLMSPIKAKTRERAPMYADDTAVRLTFESDSVGPQIHSKTTPKVSYTSAIRALKSTPSGRY